MLGRKKRAFIVLWRWKKGICNRTLGAKVLSGIEMGLEPLLNINAAVASRRVVYLGCDKATRTLTSIPWSFLFSVVVVGICPDILTHPTLIWKSRGYLKPAREPPLFSISSVFPPHLSFNNP